MIKIFSLIILCVLVSNCSIFNRYFPSKSLDYQDYESKPELILPEGMSSNSITDRMPVPEISEDMKNISLPEEVERPSPLKVSLIYLGVQKKSVGNRHWVFIDKQASQVWPELENYFRDRELEIGKSDARKGMAESQWMKVTEDFLQSIVKQQHSAGLLNELTIDGVNSYRFRVLLQPGLQRNTAKLQILTATEMREWPKVSHSVELENIILDDLAKYLGERLEEKTSVSLLAQQMVRQFEAEIIEDAGSEPYLLINQDFNQSWPLLGKAIRDASMPIYDVNRSFGLYYLSTAHEDANNFSFSKAIKGNRRFNDLEKHDDFQVYLAEEDRGVVVRVQLSDEQNADPEFALFILRALRKHIVENKS